MRSKVFPVMMLTVLFMGILTLASDIQPVKSEPETIYIRADGSVDPPTANITSTDNVTYTFSSHIYNPIVVERNNIVVDGANHLHIGTGYGSGFDISNRYRVTIKNVILRRFSIGIKIKESQRIVVSDNAVEDNDEWGIYLSISHNSILEHNLIRLNHVGISLSNSTGNVVKGNEISYNTLDGITMWYGSHHNLVSKNTIANNAQRGIHLGAYGSNVVNGNLVTAEGRLPRVYLGISVASPQNTIFGNTVKAFQNSIGIIYTAHNHIYHNNLYCPAFTSDPTNKWDNGYPSGGNYWRSYPGVDVKKGSSQDQPGSDGIGDTPHTIRNLVPSYPSGYDNYPLMKPWGSPAPPSHVLTVQSLPTGISFTVDGLSRTTPWTGTYSENASVSLVMPEIHGIYVWSHWQEDGYTNRTRIYVSTDNTTWTGVFGILGDINGDGTVNIGDILICAVAFGSEPGDLKWNPIADLDSNGIINILDLVKIGVNFGKTL